MQELSLELDQILGFLRQVILLNVRGKLLQFRLLVLADRRVECWFNCTIIKRHDAPIISDCPVVVIATTPWDVIELGARSVRLQRFRSRLYLHVLAAIVALRCSFFDVVGLDSGSRRCAWQSRNAFLPFKVIEYLFSQKECGRNRSLCVLILYVLLNAFRVRNYLFWIRLLTWFRV